MDYDFWLRICQRSKILYAPRVLANFRVWGESKTKLHKKKFVLERKILYKKYGGNMVDYGTLEDIRNKIRVPYYLKNIFQRFMQK